MTKDGMTKEEKTIAEGMAYILNQDLCGPFECSPEGCENCPIHNASVYLDKAITALLGMPIIEGE